MQALIVHHEKLLQVTINTITITRLDNPIGDDSQGVLVVGFACKFHFWRLVIANY